MTDLNMLETVIPKSDQLNADEMAGKPPMTIEITDVTASGNAEQPVTVHFLGDGGKPFKPCKSMRRVMIAAWGKEAKNYIGRRMTLYRDPKVRFGALDVGGIRISHMSDLNAELNVVLMVTKGNQKPFKVHPLKDTAPRQSSLDAEPAKLADPATWASQFAATIANATDGDELERQIVEQLGEPGAPMKGRPEAFKSYYAADKERALELAAKASDRVKALRANNQAGNHAQVTETQ